ncbi:MAG: hypothetical protein ACRD1Y_12225 [Terriglobales bacterium]
MDRSDVDLHLEFPIYSRNTGTRAQLEGQLVYDGLIWNVQAGAWAPNPMGGWHFEANKGAVLIGPPQPRSCGGDEAQKSGAGPDIVYGTYTTRDFTFIAPDGTTEDVGDWRTHTGDGCPTDILGSKTTIVQASRETYTVTTNSNGGTSAFDSEGDNVATSAAAL